MQISSDIFNIPHTIVDRNEKWDGDEEEEEEAVKESKKKKFQLQVDDTTQKKRRKKNVDDVAKSIMLAVSILHC